MTEKKTQTKKIKTKNKRKKKENKRKTTRGRENERKMYLKLCNMLDCYMYNVALNIKTLSTQIWIFLKLNIFFITKLPSLNT